MDKINMSSTINKGINWVTIVYIYIPIMLGLIIGLTLGLRRKYKLLYSIITCFLINIVYIYIISNYHSNADNIGYEWLAFFIYIWTTFIIWIVSLITISIIKYFSNNKKINFK